MTFSKIDHFPLFFRLLHARIYPVYYFGYRDMKKLIFGAVIATLLSGRVYTGTNFDESKLKKWIK